MTPTLVFDIETIPDTDGLRVLYDLPKDTSAEDVGNIALHQRRQHNGSEFLPLHQHRVCAISCALRDGNNFKVWTLGDANSSEAEIIQRFYDGIDKYTPQIISWNGGGFDLPVLHYRGLIHGVNASRYWDMGEDDKDFKWNNYRDLLGGILVDAVVVAGADHLVVTVLWKAAPRLDLLASGAGQQVGGNWSNFA